MPLKKNNRIDDAWEVNFDSLPGPCYYYPHWIPPHTGNLSSRRRRNSTANPRQAALESLKKAGRLMRLGGIQALLPPLIRPNLTLLLRLGVLRDYALDKDTDYDALACDLAAGADQSGQARDTLLFAFAPAGLWAANWATVSPSADTADGRVHLTPANRASVLYRSIEADETCQLLRQIFFNPSHFVVHEPLPAAYEVADEGAANHMRLCIDHASCGLNIFVYGRNGYEPPDVEARFLPRQTRFASEAVARLHGLCPAMTLYVQQSPVAVHAGCFHNDVIATSHRNVLVYHELAFVDAACQVASWGETFYRTTGQELVSIKVTESDLPLDEARKTYLFNSQAVTVGGASVLVAPTECRDSPAARKCLERLTTPTTGPFQKLEYAQVSSSMRNGGGPACLRLRVVLTAEQRRAIPRGILLDARLLRELKSFVEAEYPECVTEELFCDADYLRRCFATTHRLYALLGLKPIVG
jgi:succinylarginine dihydrolase